MRIGIFTDCYFPQVNGVVTSVMMLEKELISLGHDITIITVKIPNYVDIQKNIIRIKSIPFAKWKEFRVGVPLYSEPYKSIKSLNLDLIHTHTEFSIGLLGKHMAKSLKIPIMHTYHTMYEDYTHYIYDSKYSKKIFNKLVVNGCKLYVKKYNAIIVPTEKTKIALRGYGIKNDIHIVPTGVDIKIFSRIEKSELQVSTLMNKYGLSTNDNIIIYVGRVSKEKSIELIIEQLPLLMGTIENLKIMIVGNGPYLDSLKKFCLSLNLEKLVIFTGRIPYADINLYYSMADLFISASRSETQGLSITEAMASELPVIAYDDSNIKGIVIEGISGRLFATKSDLTKQIISAFSEESVTRDMTVKALNIVTLLSSENYGISTEMLYNDLLYKYTGRKK